MTDIKSLITVSKKQIYKSSQAKHPLAFRKEHRRLTPSAIAINPAVQALQNNSLIMGPGGALDNTQGRDMLGRSNESFNLEESINLNSSSILDWGVNDSKINATMSVDDSISQNFA